MKIAFVHYHVRPGGVTRVIRDQISALEGSGHKVMVISGEAPLSGSVFRSAPLRVVPSLAYDRDRAGGPGGHATGKSCAADIVTAARSVWPGGADLYHVHNPTLGKNSVLLRALARMQQQGAGLLLQIHDFAEDGRPGNYMPGPYPADCHYAVLNTRDFGILEAAGLDRRGLHLLPNAVRPLNTRSPGAVSGACGPGEDAGAALVLYPVRAIRRKNIGEAVLLSLFAGGSSVGVTLEPTGMLDVESCRAWRDFVSDRALPVLFGLGLASGLEQLIQRSRAIVTTSIKEGFGFTFLEPWTAGLPLVGRFLPEVCGDFMDHGVDLHHLYRELNVPVDLFDYGTFRSRWTACFHRRLQRYGMDSAAGDAGGVFLDALAASGHVDFGLLDEELQMQVIDRAMQDPGARGALIERNDSLARFLGFSAPDLVRVNRDAVLREFSLERNRARLTAVYETVLNEPVAHRVDKQVLLRAFNHPHMHHLLLCDLLFAGRDGSGKGAPGLEGSSSGGEAQ